MLVCLIPLILLLLCGCSQEEVYYKAQQYSVRQAHLLEEIANKERQELLDETIQQAGEAAQDKAYMGTLYVAKKIGSVAPPIVIGSIVFGAIMWYISTYTTAPYVKKIAIGVFIILIPLIFIGGSVGLRLLADTLHG